MGNKYVRERKFEELAAKIMEEPIPEGEVDQRAT
jgi:hypothetical protein